LCRAAGFRPRVVLESPRAQAVAVMVAAGSGVALLPASLAQVTGPAVMAVPLVKEPGITHVFACAAGRVSGPMKEFLALLKARR
jgi:DNA-binding transcriptional LysR family regulator